MDTRNQRQTVFHFPIHTLVSNKRIGNAGDTVQNCRPRVHCGMRKIRIHLHFLLVSPMQERKKKLKGGAIKKHREKDGMQTHKISPKLKGKPFPEGGGMKKHRGKYHKEKRRFKLNFSFRTELPFKKSHLRICTLRCKGAQFGL